MREPVLYRASVVVAIVGLVLAATGVPGAVAGQEVAWPAYAADTAASKYSALDQINRDTIEDLGIVWRQPVIPDVIRDGNAMRGPVLSQNTPLMVGGRLYVSTGLGSIAALDATTGDVVLNNQPATEPGQDGPPRTRQTRGLAYWTDGDDGRIIGTRGPKLVALNATTGEHYGDFGEVGEVDLRLGLMREFPDYYWNSAPLVINDVIIVGSFVLDYTTSQQPATKQSARGDVRGYDVRTGEQIWTFHTIPREGEFGVDTWGIDPDSDRASWEYSGNTNMWAAPSGDPELGYVYLPLSTPTNDYYGGHRPGDNLFAESLVCVDAATGKRVWHFQAVHHGVWDYDFPASANLVDITVDGREINAVAIVSKQAFTYVFDRVTGEPVWPIEERPVPPSPVPGEQLAATQPFPTKPPAFDLQGVSLDDIVDFTPELRQEAIELLDQWVWGPMFTAPSMLDPSPGGKKGTLISPGTAGGASWTGAGVDPETGVIYIPSFYGQNVLGITRSDHPHSNVRYVRERFTYPPGPHGLPLFKPPYGRLSAFDLNTGELLWMTPNGEGPRDHPAIRHLDLPWLGQSGRSSVLVTKSFVFLGEGTNTGIAGQPHPWGGVGGKKFRAYDKQTGEVIWEIELPGGTTGAPMTYMVDGTQYIVVAVGWENMPAEWVALALR